MDNRCKHKYTFFGITAILLWSCVVALIRNVSELFSPIGGAALIYSISALFLLSVMGLPKLKDFSPRYLVIGTLLFASYEICLALSLGMATNRQQTMEMGVINYLWPSLTILLTVLLGRQKVSWLVYPCALITFIGVAWCISGEQGISLHALIDNMTINPISYMMAFSAAFLWAMYCFLTKQMSEGKNAITFFFSITAIVLWIKYGLSDEPSLSFTLGSTVTVLITGIVMGTGYALWNQALIGGNLMLLGTLSYFTPVFSTMFSSIYLSVALSLSFWQGVILVTLGSLISYWVTREKPRNLTIEVK